MKICANSQCEFAGKPQPPSNFSTDIDKSDGLRRICRSCDAYRRRMLRDQRGQGAASRGEQTQQERHAVAPRYSEYQQPEPAPSNPDVYTIGATPPPIPSESPTPPMNSRPRGRVPDADTLIALVRRTPLKFVDVCDKLNATPSDVRDLITECKLRGVLIHSENDFVGFKHSEPDTRVKAVGVAPVVGQRQKVAVISDTHLGSKYCLREQVKEFIGYAYEQGVREILHPGDVLDGCYRHGIWEVSHSGLEAQVDDLYETLPKLPGLNYRCITGNHDFTFTEQSGVNVGSYIANTFKARGRNDVRFYGDRSAFLKVNGALIHLWHPKSGSGYARSYALQKQIERYASGLKAQILLTGHWHIYCHVFERGIHALACPTFQGGGSAFGKSLGGSPAIGGMILSWDLTEHGTLRSFVHEYRAYFEVEKPRSIDGDLNEYEAMPIVTPQHDMKP